MGRDDPNSGNSHVSKCELFSLQRPQSRSHVAAPALTVTVDIAMGTWQIGCHCGPAGPAGCGPGWAWQLPSAACCPLLAKPGEAGGYWGDWPGEVVTSVRGVKSYRWTHIGTAIPLHVPWVSSWGPTTRPELWAMSTSAPAFSAGGGAPSPSVLAPCPCVLALPVDWPQGWGSPAPPQLV